MTTVIVELTSDEARLLRGISKAVAGERELEQSIHEVAKAADGATESTEKLAKASGKPVSEIDKLLRELRKTGPEGGRQARAMEKHFQDAGAHGRRSVGTIIDEIAKIDAEAAEAARAAERHLEEMANAVEGKLVEMAEPVESFKDKFNEAFGRNALSQVSAYTAALAGITAAVGIAAEGFEKLKEKQDAALDSLQEQAPAEKRLAQIATSAEDLDAMLQQADDIAARTGMAREQARNLIFSARSEGFSEDVDQIARFGQVVDVESQGALAGSLGRLFKNEGLSAEQRLSGVLSAAATSAFDFETVGASVKKSAAPASAAGADLAETLAANATLANLIGESAGDRLKAFSAKVGIDANLQGQGIVGAVESLQAMPEEDRRKFLGESIELNEAYKLLSDNLEEVKKITASVRGDIQATAQGQGQLQERTAIVEGSERFQQRAAVNRSEIQKQIQEERRFAEGAVDRTVGANAAQAAMAAQGVGTRSQAMIDAPGMGIPILSSVLPEWASVRGVSELAGNTLGVPAEATQAALAGAAASLPGDDGLMGSIAGQLSPNYRMQRALETGFQAGAFNNQAKELKDSIDKQTEIQQKQLELQQRQLEEAQKPTVAPPRNYAAGQQGAADRAERPSF